MTPVPYVLIRLGVGMPRRRRNRFPYTMVALAFLALGLFAGSIAYGLWRVLTFALVLP